MTTTADRIRVLHVDDEPDFADLAATFVERQDDRITVHTASSADDARARLASQEIDCIISDYDMPGENGIEFLETVRRDFPDLPFILYTGKGSEEVASDAISAGVTDYLQKGGGTEQYAILANRIRNYVERTRVQREREDMRERIELALERTDSVIFEIDLPSGEVSRFGDYEHFFAVAAGDVTTWEDHLEHAVHPDDRDTVREFYRQLVDGERDGGSIEYRTTPETGEARWIRDDITVVSDDPRRALGLARDVTDRRHREREREQIIERVTDAIVEVDADWRFTLVNEQAEALYEMDEEFLLGRDFWEVFTEARGTRFEEEYRRVMSSREPTSFVEYFSQLDGWFDIEAYPKDDGGVAFYFIEVTGHRERQRELEASNALLSTLFGALPQGVLAEDESREVLAANQQLFDLFEMKGTPEAAIGADCERMADEVSGMFAEPETFATRIEERVDEREPIDSEELELADGRTFSRSYRPIELHDGYGHLWVYRDVTERNARERELREEQVFVEQSLDALQDVFFVFSEDGTLRRWNDRITAVTGYSEDEIADMGPTEFFPDDHRERVRTSIQDVLETGTSSVEAAVRTKDGEQIPYELSGTRLTDGDGEILGFAGIGRDITERIERERELEQQNARLDEFADVVSHDLRNPLNVAQARLEMVGETCGSDRLADIERAHDRMETLIDDLLSFAREGAAVTDPERVTLASVAEDSWMNVEAPESTLVVEADRPILADESRLKQVFENLFRNAVEHGGEDVTVAVGVFDGGFYVEDDGPGISEGERETVFDVGYSTSATGTGFGLSIVKQVVEAHDWEIRVTTGTRRGARFEVTGIDDATG